MLQSSPWPHSRLQVASRELISRVLVVPALRRFARVLVALAPHQFATAPAARVPHRSSKVLAALALHRWPTLRDHRRALPPQSSDSWLRPEPTWPRSLPLAYVT